MSASKRAWEEKRETDARVERIKEKLIEISADALFADGFEAALIGHVDGACRTPVALYDRRKCIEILMTRDKMTYEAAEEFFCFNTEGAWMGEGTPMFAVLDDDDA